MDAEGMKKATHTALLGLGLGVVILILGVVITTRLMSRKDPGIEVRESEVGGRGVFATKHFWPGDIIEACPTLHAPNGQWGRSTEDYVFQTTRKKKLLALGSCSIYNHKDFPNTTHEFSDDWSTLYIIAFQHIRPGQEIFIHYGNEWWKSRKSYKKN
jgi:uncharacterized protein